MIQQTKKRLFFCSFLSGLFFPFPVDFAFPFANRSARHPAGSRNKKDRLSDSNHGSVDFAHMSHLKECRQIERSTEQNTNYKYRGLWNYCCFFCSWKWVHCTQKRSLWMGHKKTLEHWRIWAHLMNNGHGSIFSLKKEGRKMEWTV